MSRARDATAFLLHTEEHKEKVQQCMEESCAWLASASSGARLLADTHQLRCDLSMLVLRMAQAGGGGGGGGGGEGGGRRRRRRKKEVALAVAAGAMDLWFGGKGLGEHPQLAVLLLIKAKSLSSLAKEEEEEEEEGGWVGALRYHAYRTAVRAHGLYGCALGEENYLTVAAGRLVQEMGE